MLCRIGSAASPVFGSSRGGAGAPAPNSTLVPKTVYSGGGASCHGGTLSIPAPFVLARSLLLVASIWMLSSYCLSEWTCIIGMPAECMSDEPTRAAK